jgi:glycerophosphoryl diester phosphodiesterase
MRKKQWLWWSMMGLSMGTVWGQRNVKDIKKDFLNPKSNTVLVASHRAAHNQFPENSIPAIKEAIRLGVDILEIDVKVTSDGVPVIMHDGTVNRTTTGKGKLEEMTFAQLNQLFLVEKGNATPHKVPTLEEALLVAKGHMLVDLDLKTDKMDKVLEVIRKTKTEDIVIFFDSDYETLKYVDARNKNYMMMPRAHSLAEADSAIALFQPEIVHIDFSFYTPEVVETIKKYSSRVWINALGPVDAALRAGKTDDALGQLLKHGANVVQTDEPELLLKLLKERKIHL